MKITLSIPTINDYTTADFDVLFNLKWAFQRGTTTKPNGTSRGMGLDLLKEFVKINKGKLEIFSHEGYAIIDSKREEFLNRSTFFEGTLANITFICDESYYHLASEALGAPLF